MQDMRDLWKNQGHSAWHFQQEQFENAAQEHQRVACEEVQTAAALGSYSSANDFQIQGQSQKNVEENLSQQQRIIVRNYCRVSSGTRGSDTL